MSGKKAVIKSFLTAREMQTINASVIGEQKTDAMEGARVSLPIASGLIWEKKILESALISFEENTADPIERILDLPNEEYGELKAQIYTQLKINLKPAK